MISEISIISIILLYLVVLFTIAWWVDKNADRGSRIVNNPWIYALSLAVYCTAWTFYGSVGRAATSGIDFITTFLGPSLFIPLWYWLTRKMIRVCNQYGISSLADYVSSRYGKSVFLGVFVTIFSVVAVLPYIAIQLKAIGTGYSILISEPVTGTSKLFLNDSSFYVTGILAVFIMLFGTRNIETSKSHNGLISVIATESVIKLVAFVAVGVFVSFFLYDGIGDIFSKASDSDELRSLFTMPEDQLGNWFWMLVLAFIAVLFLPRQFQMAVLENTSEKHLNRAIWVFPLYMLVINLFVIPIAMAGKLSVSSMIDPDTYVLSIPLQFEQNGLALLAYIGGFSASTSMIMVSVYALTNMISNNLVMPFVAKLKDETTSISSLLIITRRLAVVGLLFLSYLYFRLVADNFSLVSIGLISFVGVSQFAPSILIGTYWKMGNKIAAISSMSVGFFLWFCLLVLPNIAQVGLLPSNLSLWLENNNSLISESLGMSIIAASFFLSLLINSLVYIAVSLLTKQNALELKQAELFVNVDEYHQSGIVWKGTALAGDLTSLMENVLGETRTNQAIVYYTHKYGDWNKSEVADPQMVPYVEKILAGAVGSASARILVSSIVKEDDLSLEDIISVVKESQELLELNKKLKSQSEKLEMTTKDLTKANDQLRAMDKEKDSFISTVTHELRTPLTSIRSFAEILYDNPDLEENEKTNFLEIIVRETERMSRLISQVLDLEKLASGVIKLNRSRGSIRPVIIEAVDDVRQLAIEKNLEIKMESIPDVELELDRDRITQVLINLLSNAIKYHDKGDGWIEVTCDLDDSNSISIRVTDNGPGIDEQYQEMIFQKFYQVKKKDNIKNTGTGLGLAITKSIVELHGGEIKVKSELGKGTEMAILLPLKELIDGKSEKEQWGA